MQNKTTNNRQKSSYFSEEDSTVIEKQESRDPVISRHSNRISFPQYRSKLWNRSVCSKIFYLHPSDVLPYLYIAPHIVHDFVTQANNYGDIECLVNLVSNMTVLERHRLPVNHWSTLKSVPEQYGLEVVRVSSGDAGVPKTESNCTLRIPLSMRSTDDPSLAFDEQRTRNLVENLDKGLRLAREFNLRSCVRIRAAGRLRSTSSGVTLRLEATLPNATLRLVQIPALPIESTPLAVALMNSTPGPLPHCMGYLTLTAARRAVPLLEWDSRSTSTMSTPVVGAWVRPPSTSLTDPDPTSIPRNPLVWGACIRFLKSEHVLERVWTDTGVFLLGVFTNYGVFFYEVSNMNGNGGDGRGACVGLECMTDLMAHNNAGPGVAESVVCKFKAIAAFENSYSSRRYDRSPSSLSPTVATVGESPSYRVLSSAPQIQRREVPILTNDHSSVCETSAADTPQPRDLCFSSLIGPRHSMESMAELRESVDSDGARSGGKGNVSEDHGEGACVPIAVHTSQQSRIAELEREVEALREEVRTLKAASSLPPAAPTSGDITDGQVGRAEGPVEVNVKADGQKSFPPVILDISEKDCRGDESSGCVRYSSGCEESEGLSMCDPDRLEDSICSSPTVSRTQASTFTENDGSEEIALPKSTSRLEMEAPSLFDFQLFTKHRKNKTGVSPQVGVLEARAPSVPTSTKGGTELLKSADLIVERPLFADDVSVSVKSSSNNLWEESESMIDIERRYLT